jgi:predicted nucleic acid-binding protein
MPPLTCTSMSKVFIDTSAYFALVNAGDAHHDESETIFRRLASDRDELYTSNFVIAETHGLLINRIGRQPAAAFLHEVDASTTHRVRVTSADERRAREILAQFADKDFSLVDATSFAVMQRLHIARALSFDEHFMQFGFTVLQP